MKRKKFEWTGRLILIIFSLILVLSLIFLLRNRHIRTLLNNC